MVLSTLAFLYLLNHMHRPSLWSSTSTSTSVHSHSHSAGILLHEDTSDVSPHETLGKKSNKNNGANRDSKIDNEDEFLLEGHTISSSPITSRSNSGSDQTKLLEHNNNTNANKEKLLSPPHLLDQQTAESSLVVVRGGDDDDDDELQRVSPDLSHQRFVIYTISDPSAVRWCSDRCGACGWFLNTHSGRLFTLQALISYLENGVLITLLPRALG
jgi:hypothetical protein